jgi:dTDP-4-amino-4,6-dideoxygalactose transaminase
LLIVPAKPFDTLSVKERFIDEAYVGMGHTVFFTLGRYALLFTLEHFGINPCDNVLFPAYYCKSAIEPMIGLGFNISYMDITKDLNIDAQDLIQVIERNNCKAVILPDYFGLFDTSSEIIYQECNKRGVLVIKDCAHSYFSYLYAPKKHFCDAVILSIRKSVNIHYGGVAIINGQKIANKSTVQETMLSRAKFEIIKWAEQKIILVGVNIYGKRITYLKNLLFKESEDKNFVEVNTTEHEIKGLESKYLLNRNYYSMEVATLRRMNFLKLKNLLSTSGISSPFTIVNDKVPQVYPIYGDIDLCVYLRNNGIGATMWPFADIPLEVKKEIIYYPNANHFLKHLVCLPIHQGLSDKHLKKISELIHKYVATK